MFFYTTLLLHQIFDFVPNRMLFQWKLTNNLVFLRKHKIMLKQFGFTFDKNRIVCIGVFFFFHEAQNLRLVVAWRQERMVHVFQNDVVSFSSFIFILEKLEKED